MYRVERRARPSVPPPGPAAWRLNPLALAHTEYVLCDVRDRERTETEIVRAAPDVVFHLAAYKHVDLAERFPEEYVATNLDGSWNVLRAAGLAGTQAVVVASTDKAALAASRYGRTKQLMEQLATVAEVTAGAVRLVNVLGSAGSASELFLRQARAGVPLTVTDTTMVRYWITRGHAARLATRLIGGPRHRDITGCRFGRRAHWLVGRVVAAGGHRQSFHLTLR